MILKRIILTGGGTAGHVTPNLALIQPLLKEGWEVHYVGSEDGIERTLVQGEQGVIFHAVKSGKLRRYMDVRNLTDPFRVVTGMFQAASLIRQIKPDIVFSKGGFVSVPVVYGAAINHVPVLLHESDMTPGLANKLSAPFAKKMLCTFPEAAELAGEKGEVVGTPLRAELFTGSRERGLKRFGFDGSRPVLLVTGGSQGAQSINLALRNALPELLHVFHVLHLTGKGNLDDSLEGTPNYCQLEYLVDEMPDAYAVADVVVSRAGSNTVCELLALNKPSLLIPYPKSASRGDQVLNAQSVSSRHLAMMLMQEDMTAEVLMKRILQLYKERGTLIDQMEKAQAQDGVKNVMRFINAHSKTNKDD